MMRLDYEGMKKIVNFARVLEKGKASKGVSNQEEDFLQPCDHLCRASPHPPSPSSC